jgi:hypothetical protein
MRMLVEITNTLEQVGAALLRRTAALYCCAVLLRCDVPFIMAAAVWMLARQHPPFLHPAAARPLITSSRCPASAAAAIATPVAALSAGALRALPLHEAHIH